ncbi:hypothetical protein GQ53DRAFT_812003 [Thozetella sp. PMI_491]|nr:hypothetical protein GQ53DRAFT_812003 [Thozetella sp. PMI_491]
MYLKTLVFAGVASGAALTSRQAQPGVLCDGNRFPDFESCNLIVAGLDWNADSSGTTSIPAGSQCFEVHDLGHTVNCQILVCDRNGGAPPISNKVAFDNYNRIVTTCINSQQAGGASNTDDGVYQVQAWNDPDFNPSDDSKREVHVAVRGIGLSEVKAMSIARKRQQGGDNSATITTVTNNVEAPDSRQQITGRLPAGSTYVTTQADTKTQGIESSFGLEAGFFDIFTASAQITVSSSFSITSTVGVNVLIQCEDSQQGTLFWAPLFDRFQGNFQPSGEAFDVYIPIPNSAGSYDVECLG